MSMRDHRIRPSDVSPEILRQLHDLTHHGVPASLIGPDGDRVELPVPLNQLLAFVVETMRSDRSVAVVPEESALPARVAARLLGVTPVTFRALLDGGELPFQRAGNRRTVALRDLQAYQ